MNEIRINFEILVNNNLTLSEYTYLYCLYNKLEYKISMFDKSLDVDYLETLGFIKLDWDSGPIPVPILRSKALLLFEQNKTAYSFESFWADYPIKVPASNGNYRVIKSKDLNSKQAKECQTKFNRLIKVPGEDKKIKVGLDNYLKTLRPTLQYCVGVEVFLNQQLYQRYCDLEEEPQKQEKTKSI